MLSFVFTCILFDVSHPYTQTVYLLHITVIVAHFLTHSYQQLLTPSPLHRGTWSTRVKVISVSLAQSLSHPTSPPLAHIWGYRLAWKEPTGLISSDTCSQPLLRLVRNDLPPAFQPLLLVELRVPPDVCRLWLAAQQRRGPCPGAPGDVYVEGIQAPSFIWFHLDECHSVQQTMASPRHNTTLLPFKKGMSKRE